MCKSSQGQNLSLLCFVYILMEVVQFEESVKEIREHFLILLNAVIAPPPPLPLSLNDCYRTLDPLLLTLHPQL